jgi:hypothetical protein
MLNTHLRDTRLHNAAMVYAQAYPSDPWAYVRMKRDLALGIYDREKIVVHSQHIIDERRASAEARLKAWKKSMRKLRSAAGVAGRAA